MGGVDDKLRGVVCNVDDKLWVEVGVTALDVNVLVVFGVEEEEGEKGFPVVVPTSLVVNPKNKDLL